MSRTKKKENKGKEPTKLVNTKNLRMIDAGNQNLEEVVRMANEALKKMNNPPYLFQQGPLVVRLIKDKNEAITIQPMTVDRGKHEMARKILWYREDEEGNQVEAKPPTDIVRDWMALHDPDFPTLNRIVEAPVFAPDGNLQTDPGYHKAAGVYYAQAKGLKVPDVPNNPLMKDVKHALEIIDELLFDFPFVMEADRANAISLMLLAYARDLISGLTPNHLIDSPVPGSGKGLLADVLLSPFIGKHIPTTSQAHSGDEWRKKLTSLLMRRHAIILIDNIKEPLDSGELAEAMTSHVWEDRLLGRNETLILPVRCIWVCTGNNVEMSTEIARRSIRIRIDAGVERPWMERKDFKHPDLPLWVEQHRAELIHSALIIIQAWIAAGKPMAQPKFLSYPEWARVMGGILGNVGITGFLDNLDQFYEAVDIERANWHEFVEIWARDKGQRTVSAKELFDDLIMDQHSTACREEFDGFDLKGDDRAKRVSFGKQLAQQRDRIINGYRITMAGEKHHAKQWKLIPVGQQSEGGRSEDNHNRKLRVVSN